MKQFYSIVKIVPNVVTEDSIAIGIVLYDGERLRTYFSKKKKSLANRLFPASSSLISGYIKQIEAKCEEVNLEKNETKLFYDNTKITVSSYYDYLNQYSNGLLRFSTPIAYSGTMDDAQFSRLISVVFNEKEPQIIPAMSLNTGAITQIIEKKLIDKVKDRIHTNYKITSEKLPEIYFSLEMDCLGLNGSLIGAKSLSFEKSIPTIDRNLSHYYTLISTLSSKYKRSLADNFIYLISREPENIGSDQHKFWESVKKNSLIEVIDPEESDVVAKLVIEKEAKTFLD